MCAEGSMCRELGEASVSKREKKEPGEWTFLQRAWSTVRWHEGVAAQ